MRRSGELISNIFTIGQTRAESESGDEKLMRRFERQIQNVPTTIEIHQCDVDAA